MFYRPQFCCHCGEKISRAKWTLLTSRRFCDFCEIEQKQHDLIPRVAMCIAILIGAAGLTAYLAGAAQPISKQPSQAVSKPPIPTNAVTLAPKASSSVPAAEIPPANIKQRDLEKNSSTEPVYYCGALTKKGTSCTRRVKSKGHCWQHAGQQPNG
jgi:hypothetical protein